MLAEAKLKEEDEEKLKKDKEDQDFKMMLESLLASRPTFLDTLLREVPGFMAKVVPAEVEEQKPRQKEQNPRQENKEEKKSGIDDWASLAPVLHKMCIGQDWSLISSEENERLNRFFAIFGEEIPEEGISKRKLCMELQATLQKLSALLGTQYSSAYKFQPEEIQEGIVTWEPQVD